MTGGVQRSQDLVAGCRAAVQCQQLCTAVFIEEAHGQTAVRGLRREHGDQSGFRIIAQRNDTVRAAVPHRIRDSSSFAQILAERILPLHLRLQIRSADRSFLRF